MKWRSWRRRVEARRPNLRPPALDPSGLEEARQAVREAVEVHHRVLELEPVVTERSEKAARQLRENHLGPSIWRVMEGRKA